LEYGKGKRGGTQIPPSGIRTKRAALAKYGPFQPSYLTSD
jgi:hypothetical protein